MNSAGSIYIPMCVCLTTITIEGHEFNRNGEEHKRGWKRRIRVVTVGYNIYSRNFKKIWGCIDF